MKDPLRRSEPPSMAPSIPEWSQIGSNLKNDRPGDQKHRSSGFADYIKKPEPQ
jgi:hypothetical protein